MARLAIVGSRKFAHFESVRAFVRRLKRTTTVVSGGAPGVDTIAADEAVKCRLSVDVFEADWDRFGRSAGYKRNAEMIATVDGLVAFWDGRSRGTQNAIFLARQRGIWLRVYSR
jgi:hypothetical protein